MVYVLLLSCVNNDANSSGLNSSALAFSLMPVFSRASLTKSGDLYEARFFFSIFLLIEKHALRNFTKSEERISADSVLEKLITAEVVLGCGTKAVCGTLNS